MKFAKAVKNLWTGESGATLVEYGVALIMAVVVGGAALRTLAADVGGHMGQAETLLETY